MGIYNSQYFRKTIHLIVRPYSLVKDSSIHTGDIIINGIIKKCILDRIIK